MKNNLFSASIAVARLLINLPSIQAQTPTINARQQKQRARIRQGVATGELSSREAARLRGREAGIKAEKRIARAPGRWRCDACRAPGYPPHRE